MHVIYGDNINHAYAKGVSLFVEDANLLRTIDSRDGMTLEVVSPVATVYGKPMERVLWCPFRNANPFFHFFETLWILAGRDDVKWLSYFLGDIAKYSDDGNYYHGAYGLRLRGIQHDQLAWIVRHLKESPESRRATCSIFNHTLDHRPSKDIPCNATLSFLMRNGKLDLTVFCRSNDMLWGAYGANVVQFSSILEMVAGCLGAGVGTYTQVSNSFHVYVERPLWYTLKDHVAEICGYAVKDPYRFNTHIGGTEAKQVTPFPMLAGCTQTDPLKRYAEFMEDNSMFMKMVSSAQTPSGVIAAPISLLPYFRFTAIGMFNTYQLYKANQLEEAIACARFSILAEDWRLAAVLWLNRILIKRGEKHGGK